MTTLKIYKKSGVWMFDDVDKDISEEPFVGGFSELIDFVLKEYNVFNGAHRGIDIEFSLVKESDDMVEIKKVENVENDWALYEYKDNRGLLCPVTLQYFGTHPNSFFIKPKKIPFDIDFNII